ncbi:hypothetical protein [Kitasatospora fiedleri]|nr:hypothetical protein [Kitasatospora fiedleri]
MTGTRHRPASSAVAAIALAIGAAPPPGASGHRPPLGAPER